MHDRGARSSWGKTTGAFRAGFLRAIAAKVKEQRETLARLETLDNGKPISEALWDIVSASLTNSFTIRRAVVVGDP